MDNYAFMNNNYPATHTAMHQQATKCSGGCGQRSCSHQMQLNASSPAVHSGCGAGGCYQHGRPQHQNTVIVNQPINATRPAPVPLNGFEERSWTTGLFGCFESLGSCVCGFCCFPFFSCYLSDKLGESFFGPFCCKCFMIALRTRQRSAYGIKGSVCGDLCVMSVCPCCAMTQMYRELKNVSEVQM
jgi:Cys-rich protein (TIGR01571 family)